MSAPSAFFSFLSNPSLSIPPSLLSTTHSLTSSHCTLLTLLKTPPLHINYAFYHDEKAIGRLLRVYNDFQRGFEREICVKIHDKLSKQDLGTVQRELHEIYTQLYQEFSDKANQISLHELQMSLVENAFRERLLEISRVLDDLVRKPLPEKPKKAKKGKKAPKKVVKQPVDEDPEEEANEENAEKQPPKEPEVPLWQKLENLALSKRQVKELFFYHLKASVMQAAQDAIAEEDVSSADRNSPPATFIHDQMRHRRNYLDTTLREHQNSNLPYEQNLNRAQSLAQSIERKIEHQLAVKEQQIRFVQHWILMNMNMKGSLLAPTEQLTAENFMKIAGVHIFPEVKDYDQMQQQQATLIQSAIRSALARRRTESMRAASNKTIHREVELRVEEDEDAALNDDLSERESNASVEQAPEISSEEQAQDAAFYEERLLAVLEEVLTQVNAAWSEEQDERRRLFEEYAMEDDTVEEPQAWSGKAIDLPSVLAEVNDALSGHLPENFTTVLPILEGIRAQTQAYWSAVDACLHEFQHLYGCQQTRRMFQYHMREAEREQLFGD